MSERIKYIDSLRGFAIFLVVLGHSMAWTYPNWKIALESGNISTMLWWQIIYSFHMPLFFFISALLYKSGNPYSTLKKRFVNLLIPFFFVGFINSVLRGSFTYEEFPWFLRTLFEFTLIEISYDFISSKWGNLKKRFLIRIVYMLLVFYAVNHLSINGFDVIWDAEHFSLFN
jgi:fucose 4-O-acetylase-like acetyltransferase